MEELAKEDDGFLGIESARNDKSFQRITEYIKNNPANWKEDKCY